MNRASNLAATLSAMLVIASTAGAADPAGKTPSAVGADSPSGRMLAKVADFSRQARTRPEAAFVRYVGNKDKAQTLFGSLGRTLCPTTDPSRGWAYFFETSVWDLSFTNFTTAVAVFYHPWSDVALVTTWTRNDAGITLGDAELLMGDALRNRGKPPYDIEPHWLRNPLPANLAAGISSAQTLRATEQIFAPANVPAKGGWRAGLTPLQNAGLMKANHLGVGSMFERNLAGLTRYLTDSKLEPVRNQTRETLRQIRENRFDALYTAAPGINPQTRTTLEKDAAKWAQARVITCVTKRDEQKKQHTFVLLSITEMPALLMSCWFQEGATKDSPPVLKRIDLTDQGAAYKNLEAIEKLTKGS